MNRYGLAFDFDARGDPPRVYIIDRTGRQLVEVFEEPTLAEDRSWSTDYAAWTPGPMATHVLLLVEGLPTPA